MDLTAQLKCPVCKEVPYGKIFHCKNKHMICFSCLSSNKTCPTPNCKVSLVADEDRIRDIAFETFLDRMDFPCPNKALGCDVMLKRGEVLAHFRKVCRQGGIKTFFCQQIGFESCRFQCNSRQIPDILQHFQKDHNATIIESSTARVRYSDFGKYSNNFIATRYIGPPLIIKRIGHEITTSFLLVPICFANGELKLCSWMCILLDELSSDGKQFSMELSTKSSTTKVVPMKWTWTICCLENVELFLKTPPLLIPWALLNDNYCEGGHLCLEIKLQQDSVGPIKTKQLPTGERSESKLVTLAMPIKSKLDDVTLAALSVDKLSINSITQNGRELIPVDQQPITNEKLLDVLGIWGKCEHQPWVEMLTRYVRNSCGFKPDAVIVHRILWNTSSPWISNSHLLWFKTTPASIQQLKTNKGIVCFYDRVAGALSSKPQNIKVRHRQILLLCAVALGRVYESDQGFKSWETIPIPSGFDSVKGKGKLIPKPGDDVKLGDEIVPTGVTSLVEEKLELEYNEYILPNSTNTISPRFAIDIEITP